ncbi:hypothetical protein T8K17_12705 [Thalassobaculum sp. OXR-137]|uniref:hypothetical protein n=1 Tax=Thalassobaculum sp. OXR-137 TaxID=3100173 RepID=UPI002AC8F7BC|nr:hypothetical protein [Thalassobaculum sp. OXR-137]WPZ36986.1 hypothetical protein T8K17_12705 [Thalassobaculum sp. OXR-137]
MSRFRIWSNTAEYLSLSAIERPALAELYRYWRNQAGSGDLPRQKDLSIQEMGDCLGNIALIDIAPATAGEPDLPAGFPVRARYLLVGEALIKLLGVNPTGRLINQVYAKNVALEVCGALRKSMDTRQPLYYRREFQIIKKSFGYDRLILPMRLQGSDVRRILLAIYPLDSSLVSAEQWQRELAKFDAMQAVETKMASAWAESLGYSVSDGDRDGSDADAGGSRPGGADMEFSNR